MNGRILIESEKGRENQKQSSIFKHASENNYTVSDDDFEILDKGYKHDIDRKIGEALLIKEFSVFQRKFVLCTPVNGVKWPKFYWRGGSYACEAED